MSSSRMFGLFVRLILLFGVICCANWIISTMFVAPYRPLSRDDIVARRQQKRWTLDQKVCDTISVLGLRRRGCRAGSRRRQRLQATLKVTSSVNTAHRDGEIPVIVGNRSVTSLASYCPTGEEIPARQQCKQQQRHSGRRHEPRDSVLRHIDTAATAVVSHHCQSTDQYA